MNQEQLKKEIEKLIARNRWNYTEIYQNDLRSLVGTRGDVKITIPLMDSRSQTTDNL